MSIPTRLAAAALVLGLAAGCTNNAGLTNGPPPGDMTKPATRTDLPTPAAPDQATPPGAVGTVGGNDLGGTNPSGGSGSRSGGKEGAEATNPDLGKGDGSVRATPNTVDAPSPNSAAGATKPAGDIKVGSPKSPQ